MVCAVKWHSESQCLCFDFDKSFLYGSRPKKKKKKEGGKHISDKDSVPRCGEFIRMPHECVYENAERLSN